jgi:hypothetical protein
MIRRVDGKGWLPSRIWLPLRPPLVDPETDGAVKRMLDEWHETLVSYAQDLQQYGTELILGSADYSLGRYLTTCQVDDCLIAFDYSDYTQISHQAHLFDAVFMRNYTRTLEHFVKIGSAGQLLYRLDKVQQLRTEYRQRPIAPEGYIQYQSKLPQPPDRPRLYERREYVRDLLTKHFGKRLHRGDFLTRSEYLADAAGAVACVHVAGSFPGAVDRTSAEVMTMGRCLVQNTIFAWFGGQRPIAGRHYVDCHDDYSDLIVKLTQLLDDPEQAMAIGDQAWELSAQMLPVPFWSRVLADTFYATRGQVLTD